MAVVYRSWLDANPGKAGRLAELVAETVASFREAVRTQSAVAMADDETMIPATGYRHALNLILFNLGMEMGVEFAPEVYSLNVQANIWLRMVQTGKVKPVAEQAAGTPSYRKKSEFRSQETES
jgi:hypothetical protein